MSEAGSWDLEREVESIRGLAYYNFGDWPGGQQLEVFDRLYTAGVGSRRKLVLDVGPADTLTPAEAAAFVPHSLVLAVDITSPSEYAPGEEHFTTNKVDLRDLAARMRAADSLAALFKMDVRDLGAYKFDRVQMVFPTPNSDVAELVMKAAGLVKRGGELVVFYDSTPGEVSADELVEAIRGLEGWRKLGTTIRMTSGQIAKDYGLTDSDFFDPGEGRRVQVIRGRRG